MAGLLDMIQDPAMRDQISSLMGGGQLSDEDKKYARQQALLSAAAGLLTNMYKPTGEGLGRGLGAGLLGYNEAQQTVRRNKLVDSENMQKAIQTAQGLQGMNDQAQERKIIQGFYGQQGAPGNPQQTAPIGPPDPQGGMSQPVAQSSPQGTAQSAPNFKAARAAQMRELGDTFAKAGRGDKAQAYYDAAEKMMPKSSGITTMTTPDGKRVQVQRYEDGSIQILQGVGPDLEKAVQLNTGSKIGAVDPFTLKPVPGGGIYNVEMNPSESDSSKRGWANYGLAKSADIRAAAAANKPQWDSTTGQFVIPPNTTNPTGSAVTPTGLSTQGKQLTESQAKATAYVNQMDNANRVLQELENQGFFGKGTGQQTSIVNASGKGIPYVPGSGIVQRFLSSDSAQKYNNAQMQWTEQVLRFQTGANAPEPEVIRNADTFFPRPGDSDAVVEQKAQARAAMEQGMRLAAGKGSDKVPQSQVNKPTSETAYNNLPSGATYTAPDGTTRRKK
jgi:hypothetical protein